MLTRAVETYLAIRRAAGFALRCEGFHLKSFAAFSEARKQRYVSADDRHRVGGIGHDRFRSAPVGSGSSSDSPAISAPKTNVMRCRQRFSVRRGRHDRPRTF